MRYLQFVCTDPEAEPYRSELDNIGAVSYTHLDVYKRQANAWAGFGAAFGPLILLSLTWRRMTGAGAVAGLVTGATVVILWIQAGWNKAFLGGPGVYEIIPGFLAAATAIILVSLLTLSLIHI